MKKLPLIVTSIILGLALVACSSSSKPETPAEIPYETCQAIEGEISDYFSGYDVKVYVFGSKGVLDVSMYNEGQVSKAPFADFANALIIKTQELANSYELSIGSVELTFSAGEDDFLKWTTYDCKSGQLGDTYNGKFLLKNDQTIQDLVDRYGAMNWFYELAPEPTPDADTSPSTIEEE